MRPFPAALAALAAALLWPLATPAAQAPAEGRVIVTFKADAPLARRAQALAAQDAREGGAEASAAQLAAEREGTLGRRSGIALRAGGHVSERTQVFLARGMSSARLMARLAADPEVQAVVVDRRRQRLSFAPNDPLYTAGQPPIPGPAVGQWTLRAPDATFKSAIDAEGAWAFTLGKTSVIVAVLDTGVRFDHADLAGKLLPGYDFIADVATANDGSGRDSDPSDPGDWVSAADISGNPAFAGCAEEASSWHGTQTASIAGAATDNGIGMAGVGRNVRVLPLRVLGKCGGYDSDIQAALRWAAGLSVPGLPANPNKAAVINLSLGSSGACDSGYPEVIADVLAAGTTIVAAAGNSAGLAVGTPANCQGVIAVGALRHVGSKVGYSDVGPEIALSAPGGNCVNVGVNEPCLYPIVTALNSGLTTPVAGSSIYSDSYGNAAVGTSFSAPMVAGTAALMISARPGLKPADIRSLLQVAARPFPTSGADPGTKVCHAPDGVEREDQCYCTTSTCGAGMLDASAAVQAALAPVIARIVLEQADPQPGVEAVLSAASSLLQPGRTIAGAQWTLVDGGGIVSGFSGPSNGVTASVMPSGDGYFTVGVTVTDDQGASAKGRLTVAVGSGAIPPASGGGGGGGGGMSLVWLALLAAAAIAVARSNRRRLSRA